MTVADEIRQAALGLGFVEVGFAKAEPFVRGNHKLAEWLAHGFHADMDYMQDPRRAEPTALLPQAQSLIVVALPYGQRATLPVLNNGSQGIVARYAQGDDYHRVIKGKLQALAELISQQLAPGSVTRACVDTAPLLEREAAAQAGIAFIAKSTMAIAPGFGSYFLLGALLTDLNLPASTPQRDRCGTCTKCLTACPTGAFVDAYTLDARRCISYLTIEHTGVIARELRPLMGQHVFGCDICQDVCPFNASSKPRPSAPELGAKQHLIAPSLTELLDLGSKAYQRLVRGTALERVSRNQLARNAAIALGNSQDEQAVSALSRTVLWHASALVRLHAAWALGQFNHPEAKLALEYTSQNDPDESVRAEALWVIAFLSRGFAE